MKKTVLLIVLVLLCTSFCDSKKATDTCGPECVSSVPYTGKKIPDIELDAYHNKIIKRIRLADYRGKWLVLFFYPADFSYVCPTELRELASYYQKFREVDTEILSISTDSVFVHRAWHMHSDEIRKVSYPMLSDRAGKLSRALGVYVPDRGVSMRASFVVDREGTIVAYEVHDITIGRSAAELLRKLKAAQAVRESDGLLCPAGWKPGDKLIKPE